MDGKRRDGVSGRALTNVEVYQTTGWIMDCGTVRALKRRANKEAQTLNDRQRTRRSVDIRAWKAKQCAVQ